MLRGAVKQARVLMV